MNSSLNSALLEGNMVRDPLLRNTPSGGTVCNFTIATSRYYEDDSGLGKEVSFFDVETWAKLAERCYEAGKKGRGVRVVGRLRQDRWQGEDGKPHTRISIVAEHVEFRPQFGEVEETEENQNVEQDALPFDELIDESKMVEVAVEEVA